MFVGESGQASAMLLPSLGLDVAASATWQSSNTSVASVAAGGIVTARSPGVTQLSATYQGMSASNALTVFSDSDLVSLTLVACNNQLLVGQHSFCDAAATIQGIGSTGVTSKVTWSSSNPAVVSVVTGGETMATSAGESTISATYRGHTASLQFSVTAVQRDALRIEGGGPTKTSNTVYLYLAGLYSVVSAATGQLNLRVSDQNGAVIATTSPTTVPRGSDSFFLQTTATIPPGTTRVCPTAILQVAAVTISEPDVPNQYCASVP